MRVPVLIIRRFQQFWQLTIQRKTKKTIIEHLQSLSLVTVNSKPLYRKLVKIFNKYNIPWTNLCSILMDSCAVMRGSKSGLETLIHEKVAPHLLDIDGDVCHHMHNATKVFCKPFGSHVEKLFYLLFAHFKWSTDLKLYLSTFCCFDILCSDME